MFKYEFKSHTAQRPYFRTTIAKRRKFVSFPEEQTIYNPQVFTWSVLKDCRSNTLKHLANFQKGFNFKDPYERHRRKYQYDRWPILLFPDKEEWTKYSLKPTPAVEHYTAPTPDFLPPNSSPYKNDLKCSCSKRNGLQYKCFPVHMRNL